MERRAFNIRPDLIVLPHSIEQSGAEENTWQMHACRMYHACIFEPCGYMPYWISLNTSYFLWGE